METTPLHHQRLLHDIHELATKPYPDIIFHPHENDLTKACLILTPPGLRKVHLTVTFPPRYPLEAPEITIQTKFTHPNVFGDYICASILNTDEGYTPAYTLKGIAIQILSFFNSDKIQQDYGTVVDLAVYRNLNAVNAGSQAAERFRCGKCGFPDVANTPGSPSTGSVVGGVGGLGTSLGQLVVSSSSTLQVQPATSASMTHRTMVASANRKDKAALIGMPPEILIRICDFLESEELVLFMRSWEKIGGVHGVVTEYGLIRKRELQCFATKEGFALTKLGVGVHVLGGGRQGTIESEFDLLSEKAYENFGIRTSVQGIAFEQWLPLPISRPHYQMVKKQIEPSLKQIGAEASLSPNKTTTVLFAFMNDIVVKLSSHATTSQSQPNSRRQHYPSLNFQPPPDTSLRHASEKAIESYYHLFHLLLCVACEDKHIIPSINRTLRAFLAGRTSKESVPNLGHLLIMLLISDFDLDAQLTMLIIKEAITRNVVWMFDSRGAGMAELSYMENDSVSEYRLKKTYQASRTSYRLLMFANLFRRTIDRGSGAGRKSVETLRDELFDANGAPPRGAAERLAREVKALEGVDDFPNFLKVMGITVMPMASQFTSFLRECCEESVRAGYSVWALSQSEALALRRREGAEPRVGVRPVEAHKKEWKATGGRGTNFFPAKSRKAGRGGKQVAGQSRGLSSVNDWR